MWFPPEFGKQIFKWSWDISLRKLKLFTLLFFIPPIRSIGGYIGFSWVLICSRGVCPVFVSFYLLLDARLELFETWLWPVGWWEEELFVLLKGIVPAVWSQIAITDLFILESGAALTSRRLISQTPPTHFICKDGLPSLPLPEGTHTQWFYPSEKAIWSGPSLGVSRCGELF